MAMSPQEFKESSDLSFRKSCPVKQAGKILAIFTNSTSTPRLAEYTVEEKNLFKFTKQRFRKHPRELQMKINIYFANHKTVIMDKKT